VDLVRSHGLLDSAAETQFLLSRFSVAAEPSEPFSVN
jgi:hypothetical protein